MPTSTLFARKSSTTRAWLLAAGSLVPLAFGTAQAATPDNASAPQIVVKYDDLNLATSEGTQALYSRIETAARHVCAAPDNRDLGAVARSRSCQSQAIERAVQDVHSPQLAAAYAARSKHG
jgi:UrcA family protein